MTYRVLVTFISPVPVWGTIGLLDHVHLSVVSHAFVSRPYLLQE